MDNPEKRPEKPVYRWPWFVLGFVLLGAALAVFWVALAAGKIRHQRDYSEPLPSSTPGR